MASYIKCPKCNEWKFNTRTKICENVTCNGGGIDGPEVRHPEDRVMMRSRPSDLVVVGLKGGHPKRSLALAVSLDPRGPVEWRALLRRDGVGTLLNNTGAEVVEGPKDWDGTTFGDSEGMIWRGVGGKMMGTGCCSEWRRNY